jgi:hypothetical protein
MEVRHLGWTVMVYNIAETLQNLTNPFWMLPLRGGILGLKSKDVIGYASMQFFPFSDRHGSRIPPDDNVQLSSAAFTLMAEAMSGLFAPSSPRCGVACEPALTRS